MSANTQERRAAQASDASSASPDSRGVYQTPAIDTIAAETLPAIAGTDACGTTPNVPNEGECGN